MSGSVFIYVLKDPETGEVRYVGKSAHPQTRLQRHIRESVNGRNHKECWVRALLVSGLRPVLEIEDEVSAETWAACEAAYIQFYRDAGCSLVNGTSGGDGLDSGVRHPNFGRRGLESCMFGRTHTAEARQKISVGNSGEKHYLFGKQMPARTKALLSQYSGKSHPQFGTKRRGATSGYQGVSWDGKRGKWRATAHYFREYKYLGRFCREQDAADAVSRFHAGVGDSPFSKVS